MSASGDVSEQENWVAVSIGRRKKDQKWQRAQALHGVCGANQRPKVRVMESDFAMSSR